MSKKTSAPKYTAEPIDLGERVPDFLPRPEDLVLHMDDPEAVLLANELARCTGESVAQAVIVALRERLEREKRRTQPSLAEKLVQIGKECAALPALDGKAPDEILCYDESGLPA
jgi:antitoxin VapB